MQTDTRYEDISNLWQKTYQEFLDKLPDIALSLLIFVVGLIIAWVVRLLVKRLLLYMQDRINLKIKKRLLYLNLSGSEDFISRTFYWVIIIITLAIISSILEFEVLSIWFQELVHYLPNLLAVIIIVFFGIIAGRLLGELVSTGMQKAGFSNSATFGKLVRYIILFISIIIAVDQIGIQVVFLVNLLMIIAGSLLFGAALAFGLGAKSSVSNILGSYYLKKTYKEGYTVRVGDMEGVIIRITPNAVILETAEGLVHIPAGEFNEQKTVLIKKD